MNLTKMLKGESGHLDFDDLEAAYNWQLITEELYHVFHHILNCPECYDNFSVVIITDFIRKNSGIEIPVPKRLCDKIIYYIDSKH